MLCEIRPLEIDRWLTEKAKPRVLEIKSKQVITPGLSWNTRTDLLNIMSGIFARAAEWGLWKGENPVANVTVGRKKTAWPHRKLTIEETGQLLDALPADVRIICEVALYCTLRISEVLGLQRKHLGVYYTRFGFHGFRREAVTELSKHLGANQAPRMAGHSRADMSLHYTQVDMEAQSEAVRSLQSAVRNGGIKPDPDTTESANDAKLLKTWWARGDSNARPLPCQGSALTN
jgi:integrase